MPPSSTRPVRGECTTKICETPHKGAARYSHPLGGTAAAAAAAAGAPKGRVYASTWVATVRGTYPTPEAGTRTPYVQYVGPWGQAALCVRYVPNAGGWYA